MEQTTENLFPSSFEGVATKGTKKYILDYAKTLWEAAQAETTSLVYDQKRDLFVNNRKYSAGLQSVEKFKQQFSTTGDNTYINIDWGVSTPLPKMVEVLRGQMINQPYKPQFQPVDSLSTTEYDRQKEVLRAKMKIKEELAPLIEQGIIPDQGDVPEDKDELEIYMQTNFKLAQSMAMESITRAILEDNDIDVLNERIAKDLIDLKMCAVRVMLDVNKNIKLEYIDPVDLVTSYVNKPNYSDAKHIGVVKSMTIEDLRVESAGQLSEKDLVDIARNVAGRFENPSWDSLNKQYYENDISNRSYDKFNVKMLDFEMFSTDKVKLNKVKAKNGGYKSLVDEEPRNKNAEKETKVKKIKNIYCGKYIVGTDYIYDYGKKAHVIRRRLNGKFDSNTSLGFIVNAPDIHDMVNKSKVEEMIPHADKLITIQLKLQQLISKAAPSGYAINQDAMVEALDGMGMGNMTPIEARAMRDQIGDIYYKQFREDGTPLTNGPPIIALPNGLDQSLAILGDAYNQELFRMKEVIGMNDAVDSSQPDKKALIGVQKLAAAAHKNALRTLYNAFLHVNEEMVRHVSMLSQQLIRKGINKDKFINMVGEEVVNQLDVTRLTSSDFSISIKMLPDTEDKAYIDSKVELALASQPPLISLMDAFAIRRVSEEDVDKAEQLLGIREKKRKAEALKSQQQMQQQNMEMEAQVAMQKDQAAQQNLQMKVQLESQMEQQKHQQELEKIEAQAQADIKVEVVKLDGKKELVELAAEVESEAGDAPSKSGSAYDKLNMPSHAGRMPSVTPVVKPDVTP